MSYFNSSSNSDDYSYAQYTPFWGDLRAVFYATDPEYGTPGTYITTAPVNKDSKWRVWVPTVSGDYVLSSDNRRKLSFAGNMVGYYDINFMTGPVYWTLSGYTVTIETISHLFGGPLTVIDDNTLRNSSGTWVRK